MEQQDYQGLRVLVVGVEGDIETRRVVHESSADIVWQPHASGISAARNLGLRTSVSPLVAFIDDDARARAGWVAGLTSALSDAPVAGVGGPVFDTRIGLQVVRPWRVDPIGRTHEEPEVADGSWFPTLNGCNMAFRRDALASIGGFDPYYRYYFDETDVCVRLVREGYRIAFTEHAIVDHDFAEGPTRERFLYFSSRMRAYFSMKNFHERVPDRKLLLGQAETLREDFRSYRRLRPRYPGVAGLRRATKEIVVGRVEGFLDGLTASQVGDFDVATRRYGDVE